jgi:hypothetical protein
MYDCYDLKEFYTCLQANIPFARVELRLQGKRVLLDLDINELWTTTLTRHSSRDAQLSNDNLVDFSVLASHTANGDISVSILSGETILDAQIDVLVNEWEKKMLQTSDSGSLRMSASLSEPWPLTSTPAVTGSGSGKVLAGCLQLLTLSPTLYCRIRRRFPLRRDQIRR